MSERARDRDRSARARPVRKSPAPDKPLPAVDGPSLKPDVLDAAAVLRLQRTAGNASVARLLGQLRPKESPVTTVQRHIKNKTMVEYGSTNGDGLGTAMAAEIWSGQSLGKGGKPSVEPAWWPDSSTPVGAFFQSYMVQGHLLNEKIGGPGNTMKNLTPITKSANAMHEKKVEHAVKAAVELGGSVVDYHVGADYSTHPVGKELAPNETKAVQSQIDKHYAGKLPGKIAAEYTIWKPKPAGGGWTDAGTRWEIGNEGKEIV